MRVKIEYCRDYTREELMGVAAFYGKEPKTLREAAKLLRAFMQAEAEGGLELAVSDYAGPGMINP